MFLKLLLTMLGMTSLPIFYPQCVEVDVSLLSKQKTEMLIPQGAPVQDRRYGQMYFGHTPVTLIDVMSTQITLYEQEYYQLPVQLRTSIQSITITSQSLNEVCQMAPGYVVKGCARSEFQDMYLDANYRKGDLLHESIHLYSYQNDRVFSEVFMQIYDEEGLRIPVQLGNQHTLYEYFVSAYLWFLNKPDDLKALCPKTWQYFHECA